MAFKPDAPTLAFACDDVMITGGYSPLGAGFSAQQSGQVSIITYALPSLDYVRHKFGLRPYSIDIIAHRKFEVQAERIKRGFPGIRIAVKDEVHSKVALISPETIIVSSANFGSSRWHETSISVHAANAYSWYFANVFMPLWDQAKEIQPRAAKKGRAR